MTITNQSLTFCSDGTDIGTQYCVSQNVLDERIIPACVLQSLIFIRDGRDRFCRQNGGEMN